jgi:hypothetical protein
MQAMVKVTSAAAAIVIMGASCLAATAAAGSVEQHMLWVLAGAIPSHLRCSYAGAALLAETAACNAAGAGAGAGVTARATEVAAGIRSVRSGMTLLLLLQLEGVL